STLSACRRHYPGRSDGTDSLMTAPSSSAFPRLQLGRLLHYIFRGLLSVHSRYNLQTRQVALCDPLHRRLRRLCYLHRRSDCYRVERSSSRAGLSPAVVQCLSRRTVIACQRQRSRSVSLFGTALFCQLTQNLYSLLVTPSDRPTGVFRLGAQALDSDCFEFFIGDAARNEIVPIPRTTAAVDKVFNCFGYIFSTRLTFDR